MQPPTSSVESGAVVPLLTSLLRDVSRSFYLTLRVLPAEVRTPIGLAYLLARATDTIADTELVPVPQRLAALHALRTRILGETNVANDPTPQRLRDLATQQGNPAERVLLQRIAEALHLLENETAPFDRAQIRAVLDTITSGQVLDLERFGSASAERLLALQTDAELDDYTYRVAGCVGEFWTRICHYRLYWGEPWDEAAMLSNGIRFGRGLQLVNILRDLPRDLWAGRCYLPVESLAAHGLRPVDLLNPANLPRVRPLYDELLDRAQAHLTAGWAYTTALPQSPFRLRLACAWPILIGAETLAKLRHGNVLDPAQRIKVSRASVRRIMLQTILYAPSAGKWNRLYSTASATKSVAAIHTH
jgi:farnesyl-diphosphate farnesyltransferase